MNQEEYTAEYASRLEAIRNEKMQGKEGVAGRSRASTLTDFQPLPPSIEEDTQVEKLMIAVLGEDNYKTLKEKVEVIGFGDIEEATRVVNLAREEGKFTIKLE